jgi:large subunit ribosomal protein L17
MKHQKKGRKFGRVKNQRKALLSGLLSNLIMKEKIETTVAKAKEVKGLIDQIINKAKKAEKESTQKVAILRDLRNVLSLQAVKKMKSAFLEKFEKRNSGYTRVIKLAKRKSDAAQMAIIEFV